MMRTGTRTRIDTLRRLICLSTATFLVAATMTVVTAPAASAAVSPVADRSAAGVSADALPTVQIDGVVWSQAIVGNTVYAGGSFANARPAGAAAGTNQTPRANLLSYDLTTGALVTSFAPALNAQVKAVTASPDGSRIYVGGSFTTANGVNRYRLAAYSTATGTLISTFAPSLDATVNSITATDSTVYVGGVFGTANGSPRSRLAAFSAANGALLAWAPSADNVINAVQLTPDGSKVIVGGAFKNINGATAIGLGAVGAVDGSLQPFAANQVVQDSGTQAAIESLSTDGNAIYGAGYTYGADGNFEGVFSANPSSGAINWLADCHGDSYGAFASGDSVYVVSHEHYCANIGGFPDTSPRTVFYRTSAFTTAATGTVLPNGEAGAGYGNFAGQPSPSLRTWYPNLDIGSYTGQSQGAWTVTGTSKYVIEGGEFQHVNGTAQQGLVRFAIPSAAPNKRGPQATDTASITPTVTATSGTSATVGWPSNWDQDDQSLTYQVYRTDQGSTPVYTVTAASQPWNRPTLTWTDTGLSPGRTYSYYVRAVDANGNAVRYATVSTSTQATKAAIGQTCAKLTCSFTDTAADASVRQWDWDFGDGQTSTNATPSHTYATAGAHTVQLTVRDTSDVTYSASRSVSVSADPVIAADAFARTTTNGWGSADTGGAWSATGGTLLSTTAGVGVMNLSAPGAAPSATLDEVAAADVVETVSLAADKAATGSGHFLSLQARVNGTSNYTLKVRLMAAGVVHLVLSKVVNGIETILADQAIRGLTYAAGNTLRAQFAIHGSGTASVLKGTVWRSGATAPAPQVTVTDSEARLQGQGSVALQGYLSGSATNAPVQLRVDDFRVTS